MARSKDGTLQVTKGAYSKSEELKTARNKPQLFANE